MLQRTRSLAGFRAQAPPPRQNAKQGTGAESRLNSGPRSGCISGHSRIYPFRPSRPTLVTPLGLGRPNFTRLRPAKTDVEVTVSLGWMKDAQRDLDE